MIRQLVHFVLNVCGQKREPFSLVHFITSRCNARCRHCFINFAENIRPEKELKVDEIDALTRTLGESLYNVNLTGGEPFIRDDVFKIAASYVRNSPVRSIVITTNGWFVDSIRSFVENYKKLETSCKIKFSISIDNHAKQHDFNRRLDGLFERAMASYHIVEASGDPRISVDAAITVTPDNKNDVDSLILYLASRGVHNLSPILLREEGILKTIPEKEDVLHAYRRFIRRVERDSPACHLTGAFHRFADAVHKAKNRIAREAICTEFCSPRFITPCYAGSLFGTIHADGNVSPCELLAPSWSMGNLRNYDLNFMRLWHNQRAEKIRRIIRRKKCHCTFECAWTVNVIANPVYFPRLFFNTLRELL